MAENQQFGGESDRLIALKTLLEVYPEQEIVDEGGMEYSEYRSRMLRSSKAGAAAIEAAKRIVTQAYETSGPYYVDENEINEE